MNQIDLLKRAEWIVAILLSAAAIVLLAIETTHAGGLWRDECAVTQLAQMPSVSDILHNFQHEAFPPFFPLIVRGYMFIFGSTDIALRTFGFVVGSSLILALWINARLLRRDVPLIGLALIVLNTTFFVWGTTIRGYGLGSTMIVLIFGCVAGLLLDAGRTRVVITTLISVLGVQVLLYNSVLLLAISGAAAVILFLRCQFKRGLIVLAVCGIGLLSLVPYAPSYFRARDWNILVRGWPTSYSLWKHFEVALGNPGYSIPALWYCIALGLVGVFLFQLYRYPEQRSADLTTLVWFSVLTCALAIIGCYAFLRILSYTTSDWYYLAFICVCVAALDLIGLVVCASDWMRALRIGIAIATLVAAPFANWSALTERHTNVDLTARTLNQRASANDLVVVVPWQFGIPFNRYYRGRAHWITIPNIEDHLVHRYDLIKAKMISGDPIDDLIQAMQKTLSSGNRVWFVGGLNLPKPEEGPMILPPAPASRFKWDNRAYTAAWWQQLSVFTVTHAGKVESIPLPQLQSVRVNELEQTSLVVAQGWH